MPHYDYECSACGHKFEAFHSMSAKPLITCDNCGKDSLVKLIGMGAAAIVKGTNTPCTGGRGQTKQTQKPNKKRKDKLGEGVNKGETPFWRNGPINKKILKNPEKYIKKGIID